MRIAQHRWRNGSWGPALPAPDRATGLALVFGSPRLLRTTGRVDEIRQAFPHARLVGCSTAGEIFGTEVGDDTLTCTAVTPTATRIRVARAALETQTIHEAGAQLAEELRSRELRHVLVFAEGLHVNGSELARGMQSVLPHAVSLTGGLAGDGDRFQETVVLCDEPTEREIVGVGFYGECLRVGYGSLGGWDPVGPERVVTGAEGNVLLELDGQPALEVYRQHLGPDAAGLPASGLRFPLSLTVEGMAREVVRTLLAVDDATQSIRLAGDVPVGSRARFMQANFERLVDGATRAATASASTLRNAKPELAVLVSCVGRKLVLRERVADEVQAVRRVLGGAAAMTGFYSYGELAPALGETSCRLHNQTMTITALSEA